MFLFPSAWLVFWRMWLGASKVSFMDGFRMFFFLLTQSHNLGDFMVKIRGREREPFGRETFCQRSGKKFALRWRVTNSFYL